MTSTASGQVRLRRRHNEEVFREWIGLAKEEIERLKEEGVV